jgi:hypothetical protein
VVFFFLLDPRVVVVGVVVGTSRTSGRLCDESPSTDQTNVHWKTVEDLWTRSKGSTISTSHSISCERRAEVIVVEVVVQTKPIVGDSWTAPVLGQEGGMESTLQIGDCRVAQ